MFNKHEGILMELDNEQQIAISAKSPILVNASAGSGKTRCLITKILRLIASGINPASICAVTFTNKAANEMKERLKAQCNTDIKNLQVSTIHSLCVRIMKDFIQFTPLNLPFSIYDESDQQSIIKTIIKAREYKGDPKEYITAISNVKSVCESSHPDDIKEAFQKNNNNLNEFQFLKIYETYQNILWKNNACDFDDLLIYANVCLKHEKCSNHYSDLWRHILVDEFQDTSVIQYKIINQMYNPEKTETLFVVADFNQAIYCWRNANPENINDFIKKYEPTICNLSYNYRSGSSIINHANKFLQYGAPMVSKSAVAGQVSFTAFNSQEEEAEKISNALLRKGDFENTAILFRINSRSLLFERAFARRRIPYKVIGTPYYKRKVSKDLLSFLKASTNRSDLESLVRIVNVPARGFGEKKQEILLHEGWPYLKKMAEEMPKIQSFISLLDEIKDMSPYDAINEVLYQTEYRSTLKRDTDHTMLTSLIDISSGYRTIEELVLASTFLEEDSGYGVKLLTAHASKGLEFNTVLVVGLEEGVWPHRFSTDKREEDRLFYVACTRAKKHLNISYSKSRLYRGQTIPLFPSSLFIKGIKELKDF